LSNIGKMRHSESPVGSSYIGHDTMGGG
jgi:hypothetical protein